MNTIDGPTKLVRQDAILGWLSIGQLGVNLHMRIAFVKTLLFSLSWIKNTIPKHNYFLITPLRSKACMCIQINPHANYK